MIATCPTCRNTGAIGERYCSCPAATAPRARIEPLIADINAQIDLLLGRPSPFASLREPTGDELTLN